MNWLAHLRLAPPFRRLSPVLVDVYFDHVLARGWRHYGDGGPLRGFVDAVYGDLERHRHLLPPRLHAVVPRLRDHDWLRTCGELDGIAAILGRMAGRLRRPDALADGALPLREHLAEFTADFAALWPDLLGAAAAVQAQPLEGA
ncbi:MAG: DUF479 domain-containing protein, partial [Planctomycetes bacterium]|nr:DUF479 domain-containing protein [Planctomycetota bacterium]